MKFIKAADLCSVYQGEKFRFREGARVIWESIAVSNFGRTCRVSRFRHSPDGKLEIVINYISLDAELIIIKPSLKD